MKRKTGALALILSLLLSSCASPPAEKDDRLHILCTTYPVYLFTTALTGDLEDVEVTLLVNAQTSCLHDYTLTVKDMKAIEGADVIVMNGAGLEGFMADVLSRSAAQVIDCSQAVELLPTPEHAGHDGHDHEEEYDPHFWMDPHRAGQAVEYIAAQLSGLEEANAEIYAANCAAARAALDRVDPARRDAVFPPHPLITFHDGFQYFAAAFGFDLLKAIEEEEGSTASAREIVEITGLIEERDIAAIFTERSGSKATAEAIARETGCGLYELDMLMSGDGEGIGPYIDAINANLKSIFNAFGEYGGDVL